MAWKAAYSAGGSESLVRVNAGNKKGCLLEQEVYFNSRADCLGFRLRRDRGLECQA